MYGEKNKINTNNMIYKISNIQRTKKLLFLRIF